MNETVGSVIPAGSTSAIPGQPRIITIKERGGMVFPEMEERALWVNIHNGMTELNGKLRGGWRVKQITPLNVAAVGIPDPIKPAEVEALDEGETSVGEVEGKPKPTPVIFYQSDCLVIVEREKRNKPEEEA